MQDLRSAKLPHCRQRISEFVVVVVGDEVVVNVCGVVVAIAVVVVSRGNNDTCYVFLLNKIINN